MQNTYTKKTVSYQDVMVAYLLYALKQRIQTDWYEWRVRKPRLPEHWLELKELPQEFFEQLAEDITNDKAVKNYKNASISSDTLKRLVGKKAQNKGVYVASLHAICLYLWQIDWFDFIAWLEVLTKLHQPLPTALPAPAESAAHTVALQLYHFVNPTQAHDSIDGVSLVLLRQTVENKALALRQAHQQYIRNEQTRQRAFFSIAFFVPLVFLGWFWFNSPKVPRKFTEEEIGKIKLKLTDKSVDEYNGLGTFYYEYDFSALGVDTLGLLYEFGNSESNPTKLYPAKGKFSFICTKPNASHVYLTNLAQTQILKAEYVHVPSGRWVGWEEINGIENRAKSLEEFVKKGRMYLDTTEIEDYAKNRNKISTQYKYANNFGINADSCEVSFEIKNAKSEGGVSCFDTSFSFGNKAPSFALDMTVLIRKGCGYYSTLWINKNYYTSENQLKQHLKALFRFWKFKTYSSDFSIKLEVKDTEQPHKIRVKLQKPYYSIYLNDTLAYTKQYEGKIGALKYLAFTFKGIGSVYWIRIRDRKGREVYFEDFNDPKNMAKPKKFED